MTQRLLPSLASEMSNAPLGDRRLSVRLTRIIEALAAAPADGLPKALRTEAALEAAYRFMRNPAVTPHRILQPHFEATGERARQAGRVLAIHDTTEFGFNGTGRRGLGRTNNSKPGFFAHIALAVAEDGHPLGVAGLHTWVRREEPVPKKIRDQYAYQRRRDGKESDRWIQLMGEVERACAASSLIHVMDREGDQFRVISRAIEAGSFFVIRALHKDRVLLPNPDGHHNLADAAVSAPVILERDVTLSRRTKKHHRSWANRPREGRDAQLQISATTVEIKRSWAIYKHETPPTVKLNVVRVVEVHPPDGEEPVEWVLLTNLPVDTSEDVAFVVDCYRARWLIEEFFKAVKTGCEYEKLQLESETTLLNALAMMLPIAWQMLLLRSLSRREEPESASRVLSPTQLAALKAITPFKMGRHPTVREALLSIAALGGHIRNNGDPGWLVLYRGFRDLMLIERGWALRSDQS
jgi:hypothetical protein